MTRPHQRVRTTPLSSVYMLETSASSPPAAPVKKGYGKNFTSTCDNQICLEVLVFMMK